MMKPRILLVAVLSVTSIPACKTPRSPSPSAAVTAVYPEADPSSRALAEREVARRAQALSDARHLLEEGKAMAAQGDVDAAVETFRRAIDTHP